MPGALKRHHSHLVKRLLQAGSKSPRAARSMPFGHKGNPQKNLVSDDVRHFDVLLVKRIDSTRSEFVRNLLCETIDQSRAPGHLAMIEICLRK